MRSEGLVRSSEEGVRNRALDARDCRPLLAVHPADIQDRDGHAEPQSLFRPASNSVSVIGFSRHGRSRSVTGSVEAP